MPEQEPDLFDRILELLAALIMPVWSDLFALIPIVLLLILVAFFALMALMWRNAGRRNRPPMLPSLGAPPPPAGVHLPGPSRWPFVVPLGATLLLFAILLPSRDADGQVFLPVNITLFGLGLLVTFVAIGGWLLDAMKEWRHTAAEHPAPAGRELAIAATDHPALALLPGAVVVRPAEPPPAPEPPPGVHMPGPSPWPFFAPIGLTVMFFGLILNPLLVVIGLIMAIISAAGWLREASREWRSVDEVGHAVPQTHDPERAWPKRLVPVFAAFLGLGLLVLAMPTLGAWLEGLRPADATPTPMVVPAQPVISARSAVSFDTRTLIVPCCRDFELDFDNQDPGVPHDVVISDSAAGQTVYFDGDIITGPDTITYQVPALADGDYYFFCSIHPNMNGTVMARPETGEGGGLPPGPPVPPSEPPPAP